MKSASKSFNKLRNITEEQAKKRIKNAKISATVWKCKFERFYGVEGTAYVNLSSGSIRTAFSSKDYTDSVKAVLEVLREHGI